MRIITMMMIALVLVLGQQTDAQEKGEGSDPEIAFDFIYAQDLQPSSKQPTAQDGNLRYELYSSVSSAESLVRLGMTLRQIEDRVISKHLPFDDSTGMVVDRILANLPANKAGIAINDIITRVGDSPVLTVEDFVQAYETTKTEDVSIEYVHAGQLRRTSINKAEAAASGKRFRIGVHTSEIPDPLAKHFDLSVGSGLYVTLVVEDSPAEKAGVKTGDILLAVGRKKLTSTSVLADAVQAARGEEPIEIEFLRKGRHSTSKVLAEEDAKALNDQTANLKGSDLVQLRWEVSPPVFGNTSSQSNLLQIKELADAVGELQKEIAKLREELRK